MKPSTVARAREVSSVLAAIFLLAISVNGASAASIGTGFSFLQTLDGGATADLSSLGLGMVPLTGVPVGPGQSDTIIERLTTPDATGEIQVEIVALNLQSVDPVPFDSGSGVEPHDVIVGLDTTGNNTGTMTIDVHDDPSDPPSAGTFHAAISVAWNVFLRNQDGTSSSGPFRQTDLLVSSGVPWSHIAPPDHPAPQLAGEFFEGPIVHGDPRPITFPPELEGEPGLSSLPPRCRPAEFRDGFHLHEQEARWVVDPGQLEIDLTPPSIHCPTQLASQTVGTSNTTEQFDAELAAHFDVFTPGGTEQLSSLLVGPTQTRVHGNVDAGRVSETGSWQTEMLSLDLRGALGMFDDIRIRLDPNRPTLGRTTVTENPPAPVLVSDPDDPAVVVIPVLVIPHCGDEHTQIGSQGEMRDPCHELLAVTDQQVAGGDLTETLDTRFTADLTFGTESGRLFLNGPTEILTEEGATRQTGTFDTEILSMDLTGHVLLPDGQSLPAAVREGPNPQTQRSRGETTVTDLGDRTFQVDSFFDVWTEVSIAGGAFQPASNAVRLHQQNDPTAVVVADPAIPVLDVPECATQPIDTASGLRLEEHCHQLVALIDSALQPDGSVLDTFDAQLRTVVVEGNQRVPLNLSGQTQVLSKGVQGEPGTFDTEILSMDLSGVDPGGSPVQLSESPRDRSTGRTTVTELPDSNFRVDSFFDVFYEIEFSGTPPESLGPVRTTQSRVDNEFIVDSFFDVYTEISLNGEEGPWTPQEDAARMRWGPKPRAGDLNGDDHTTVGEINESFANYTGPVNPNPTQATIADRRRSDGDNDGSRDVTVGDLLFTFADFTGPPAAARASADSSGSAQAGSSGIADLVYDSSTGNVQLDPEDGSILGFELQNAPGGDDFTSGASFPPPGVSTDIATEVSWASLDPIEAVHDLGEIFPTGMTTAEEVETFLTSNRYSPGLGLPVTDFEIQVVPEPRNMLLFGIWALGILARHRGRRRSS